MNNKRNKILIGCIALLLVLSVGYALFSQNIVISGTATAQGDFNITPTCIAGPVEGTESYFSTIGIVEKGYKNESCQVNDTNDTITISTELEYPGAGRLYTIKMTNTGSIDAIAPTQIELNPKYKFCYSENKSADPEKDGTCYEGGSGDAAAYAVQVGKGTVYLPDENAPQDIMQEFMVEGIEGLILKPGNSLYYVVYLAVPEGFTTNSGVLNAIYKAPYKATFTQKTN